MNIGSLEATLGCDSSGLRRAEGDLRQFGSTADSTFSKAISTAAAYAAAVLSIAAAYRVLSDVATTGMRVETMGVVMNQIGKNVQISTQALQYFKKEVESTGVTGMEAMSALSKAMTLGLNLNQMKEFTTRVRDVAVGARDAAGNVMNTSQTVNAVMHGIQSGQVEVLRNLGVTVRGTEEVYKAYAKAIGKTKEELNDAQKAQAMMNEFMRASATMAGSAAAADETVGKQLASMARYSEEAKVALWSIFQPGMMAAVQGMTQGFKDLRKWAEENSVALSTLGKQIGEFVVSAISAAGSTVSWAAANFELIKALTELYIISKVMTWINSLQIAIRASTAAVVIFTGVTQGLIPVMFGAATTSTIFASGATGMATAMYSATAAGSALNAMMVTLLPATIAVVTALAVYGAYKTFTQPGQLTGPTSSGDPFADVAAGARTKDLEATAAAQFEGPPAPPPAVLQMNKTMEDQKKNLQKYIEEANAAQATALAKPGGAGKEGKGAAGAEDSLKSFIETMNQETARGAGDSEAILNAWYSKQAQSLEKLAAKGIDVTLGKEALDAAYYSKLDKLDSDFNDYYISGLGKSYEALYAAEDKKLKEVAGNADKTAKVQEVFSKKWQDLQEDQQITATNLFKGYLDAMAGLSPMLADQLGYKKQALSLELNLADLALDKQLREQKITQEMYDQAKVMQALVAQAKKYNLEMENNKGLQGWAYGRSKEIDQRNPLKDAMTNAESWLGTTFGDSVYNSLVGKKDDLKQLFQNLMGEAIKWVYKFNAQTLMDSLAGMVGPKKEGLGSLTQGVGALSALKQTPIEKRIDATELKNLTLESRAFTGFSREINVFSDATQKFGQFSQKGVDTQSKYAAQINTSFPQLTQASEGLSSTVSPITGAAMSQQTSSAASTMSSIAQVGAAAGMALSAIGILTGSKELSMAGMVISTAAAILQTAAMIMMASSSVPILHSGGLVYAHAGWPPKRPGEVDIRALKGERVLSIAQNRDYEAGMRAVGSRPGENGTIIHAPITFSPVYNYRPTQADMDRDARMMVKAINKNGGLGTRGQKLGGRR